MRGSRRSCASTRSATASGDPRAHPPRLLDRGAGTRRRAAARRCARAAAPASPARAARPRAGAAARRSDRPRPSRGSRRAASLRRSASRWKSSQRSRRSTGSSPTVGSSRTSRSGSPSSAVASETRARCPPERRPTTRSGMRLERRRRATARSTASRAEAQDAREEAEVLAHGQVAVDGRRLRHVADLAAQRLGARGVPEHLDAAARDTLHADDRANQRRLAAAARAEEARHGAGGDVAREVGQHVHAAALDVQVLDLDRGHEKVVPAST